MSNVKKKLFIYWFDIYLKVFGQRTIGEALPGQNWPYLTWDMALFRQKKYIYIYIITLHISLLYSPGPVPDVLAHRMKIWSNPLKKRFNSAYL